MNKSDLVTKFKDDVKKRHYLLRLALVVDQLFNVLIWNGSQDETISSHIGRRIASNRANKIEKAICWVLNKIENKHCFKAKGE